MIAIGYDTGTAAEYDPWGDGGIATTLYPIYPRLEEILCDLVLDKDLLAIWAYEKDRESWDWPRAKSLYKSYIPVRSLRFRKLLVSMSGWVGRKAKKIKKGN